MMKSEMISQPDKYYLLLKNEHSDAIAITSYSLDLKKKSKK